jgi:hypothetical protein
MLPKDLRLAGHRDLYPLSREGRAAIAGAPGLFLGISIEFGTREETEE